MVKKANPNYDLIKQFIEYLRDTKYILMKNELFRESVMLAEIPPSRGNTTAICININGKIPSDKEVDTLINTFLTELDNSSIQKNVLLEQFLEYLRGVDYTLLKKEKDKNYSNFANTLPKKGDSRSIKIILELNIPSEKVERVLINLYLDELKNS